MRGILFPDSNVIQLRNWNGFTRGHSDHLGVHLRPQLKFRRKDRIDGRDLCARVQQEGVRTGLVDGDCDDIEILCDVARMYTGDVSRTMGRVRGWQQEKTCQSRPLDMKHWRSPRP